MVNNESIPVTVQVSAFFVQHFISAVNCITLGKTFLFWRGEIVNHSRLLLSFFLCRFKFNSTIETLIRNHKIRSLSASKLHRIDMVVVPASVADPGCLSRIRFFPPGSRVELRYF